MTTIFEEYIMHYFMHCIFYIFNIISPIIKNSKINGNKINNQDNVVCPSLQIKFNTYVQNKIYTNLIKNTIIVLGTRH
jgi:hypothetical protein